VIEVKRAVVHVITQLLRSLLERIANLDGKIAEAARAHPDFFIFQSLLRAETALAPCLLAAFRLTTGSLRQRRRGAETQWDRTGDGDQWDKEMGAFPLGPCQVSAAEFSRMGGTPHCGNRFGPATIASNSPSGERTPCYSVRLGL
jgi:hypothetical protein